MHGKGIIKIVWYGYVCFTQCTVTEFLMAEKSIMNIHKQLKDVYSVRAVDKSTVKRWSSWIAGSKKGHAELSDSRHPGHPTTAVIHILLQPAEDFIQNNGQVTTIKLTTELSISKGTVKTLLIPWDIQKCVLVHLHEPTINLCGKTCIQICCPITRLREKAFCHGSYCRWNMNHFESQTKRQSLEIVSPNFLREV